MTRYIIALTELGLKNNNLISLLREHSSDIVDMFENRSQRVFEKHLDLMPFYDIFSDSSAVDLALSKADDILTRNKELGIKTTYLTASSYPKGLALISNPPAILYYKGAEFSDIPSKAIACVGTRKPTRISYNAVNYLVPQWVHEDCSIISGLASGVDKLSHQACISAGGKTIAVLAHGLDTIYPKENSALAERILESGGILMSEYAVGTKPDRFRFVNRNRLIVGLSKVVVIYECDEKGGTMHNVEHAGRQKKPIFCPTIGEVVEDIQTGTKKLIDEGTASVIQQGRDIAGVLDALGSQITKPRLNNTSIKLNYLHAVLSILNDPAVLEATLKTLNINIPATQDIYTTLVHMVNDNSLDIDKILNLLVENNIASINKTLILND